MATEIFHGNNLIQRGSAFYGRFWIDGKRTKRVLKAITITAARAEVAATISQRGLAAKGLAHDPFARELTIAELVPLWKAAGYARRKRDGRPANEKVMEFITGNLIKHIGHVKARDINPKIRNLYHERRIQCVKAGFSGARTVEIDLVTLANMLVWATDHVAGFCATPESLMTRRYRGPVEHCTARMPRSDDELHTLANHIFEDVRTAPMGWMLLFEALTGCRSGEMRLLRMDAAPEAAGHVTDTYLTIERLKRGCSPWALLEVVPGHAPLRDLIHAHRAWHAATWPASPWYFPGNDGRQPSSAGRLTHSLAKACSTLGLHHMSSHGLRAYAVSTMRSLGIDDSEIAKRIGQRSGVSLIETTYGESKPGWFGSRKQDFLPDPPSPENPDPVPCAWAPWLTETAGQPNKLVRVKFA